MWPFSRGARNAASVPGVSVREVQSRMKRGAKLVDVRTKREFDAVHPAGSISVPPERIKRDEVGLPHDAEILVICLRGHRSPKAARRLMNLGYTNVTDVLGGFDAWTKFGLPVKRTRKRQG
jgi:rhodanese-related sulfurtransferase